MKKKAAPHANPNPYGSVTHALFSADKIDKRIGFYHANGIDSTLFKLYRDVKNPAKAVLGQFTGGKGSVSGTKDMGEVFDKAVAVISVSAALKHFGTNGLEILEMAAEFNDINELKTQLPAALWVKDVLQPSIK